MKTNDMIALLAANIEPVDPGASARRFAGALLLGALGSAVAMGMLFGVRPDISAWLSTPLFWARLAFPACIAAAGLSMVVRLSHPGVSAGRGWQLLAISLALAWMAAAGTLMVATPSERLSLLLGATWQVCSFNIAFLTIPTFIGVIWAIRGLAPTRLRSAGAAAGVLASAIATMLYCLHCPEMAVSFWAVWYVAGMALAVGAGAMLGPVLLRW